MQLLLDYPKEEGRDSKTVPIEDIGIIILDHPRINVTQALISELAENNVAIISCDAKHLPIG